MLTMEVMRVTEDNGKAVEDWEHHKHIFEEKWLSINGTNEEIAKYRAGILLNSEFNETFKRSIIPSLALRRGFHDMIDSIKNLSKIYPEIKKSDLYKELKEYF